MTRLLAAAAALACAAGAPVAQTQVAGVEPIVDARSAIERHWLAYHALQTARAVPAARQPQ